MWALRVSHSAVVDAWRERERCLVRRGHRISIVAAAPWERVAATSPLRPAPGEDVRPASTWGSAPRALPLRPPPALARASPAGRRHRHPRGAVCPRHGRDPAAAASRPAARPVRPLLGAEPRQALSPFRSVGSSEPRCGALQVCRSATTSAGRIVERKGFPGRARVIPLGVDVGVFTPSRRRRAKPSDGRVVVGFAGRLDRHKGAHVLVEAVAAEPALVARMAGDGPERQNSLHLRHGSA